MQSVDGDAKPLAKGVSPSADFALEHNGMMHDSDPWSPHTICSGGGSIYRTPVAKLVLLGKDGMTASQRTTTWPTFNDRTTTTQRTAPTSIFSGSEAGSSANDQKATLIEPAFGVVDWDPSFPRNKTGAREARAVLSAKGKGCFNLDLVNGIGQNEALLEDEKERTRRPWADTLQDSREQPKVQSMRRDSITVVQARSSTRDLESQEAWTSPTRFARLHFLLVKLVVTLGKNLIKPFYPPSKKKARRIIVLATIATALTAVTILRRTGHSVSDMSGAVIAISALGTFMFNALADSSTPWRELRRFIRTLSWRAQDEESWG